MTGLVGLLIYVLVIGLVLWLCMWVIGMLPLPAPFKQVATVIVVVIACLVLINLLLVVFTGTTDVVSFPHRSLR